MAQTWETTYHTRFKDLIARDTTFDLGACVTRCKLQSPPPSHCDQPHVSLMLYCRPESGARSVLPSSLRPLPTRSTRRVLPTELANSLAKAKSTTGWVPEGLARCRSRLGTMSLIYRGNGVMGSLVRAFADLLGPTAVMQTEATRLKGNLHPF